MIFARYNENNHNSAIFITRKQDNLFLALCWEVFTHSPALSGVESAEVAPAAAVWVASTPLAAEFTLAVSSGPDALSAEKQCHKSLESSFTSRTWLLSTVRVSFSGNHRLSTSKEEAKTEIVRKQTDKPVHKLARSDSVGSWKRRFFVNCGVTAPSISDRPGVSSPKSPSRVGRGITDVACSVDKGANGMFSFVGESGPWFVLLFAGSWLVGSWTYEMWEPRFDMARGRRIRRRTMASCQPSCFANSFAAFGLLISTDKIWKQTESLLPQAMLTRNPFFYCANP